MSPEERQYLNEFAKVIDDSAATMSEFSRAIGIEWSKSDAQDAIREAFTESWRQTLIEAFKVLHSPKKKNEPPTSL